MGVEYTKRSEMLRKSLEKYRCPLENKETDGESFKRY